MSFADVIDLQVTRKMDCDSDVHSELLAMTGASSSAFAAGRTISKSIAISKYSPSSETIFFNHPKPDSFNGSLSFPDVPSKSEGRNGKMVRQVFTVDNTQSPHIGAAEKTKQIPNDISDKPPSIPVLSSGDKATKMELEAILRKPANSPEER